MIMAFLRYSKSASNLPKVFYRTCAQRICRKRMKSFFTYYFNTLTGRNLSHSRWFSYLRSRIGSNECMLRRKTKRQNMAGFLKTLPGHCNHSEVCLKGTVPEDFRLLVFSWISIPQAPEYTIRAVSNFLTQVTNLQPVSTTPVVLVAKFATGVVDTRCS